MKIEKTKILGVIFIVLSFFFFYLASRFDFDYVTRYYDEVNLADITSFYYEHEFGDVYHWIIKPFVIGMQPNDYLTISYEPVDVSYTYGIVYIVLWRPTSSTKGYLLKYSRHGFLDYKNREPNKTIIKPYLAHENLTLASNNVLTITISLHHYERPHWLWYSLGVISASSALIIIWKPKFLSISKEEAVLK